jgi:hypothetical protein
MMVPACAVLAMARARRVGTVVQVEDRGIVSLRGVDSLSFGIPVGAITEGGDS